MTDASWNTYTPAAPRRFPGWLKALMGIAAGLVLLVTLLVSYQQGMRRKAWPLVRSVAARLATDEGTLDLYRRNLALHAAYPSEQAFLDHVRPLRAGLVLPEQEPLRNRGRFATRAGLTRLVARVRGEGGTWMELTVDTQGTLGGEGIAALWLADSRAGLLNQPGRRHVAFAAEWQRFRDTAAALAMEAGARGVVDRPHLLRTPADPTAFLALCRQRKAALAGLPEAVPAERDRLTLAIHGGLFRRTVRMTCALEGGGRLSLAWRNDQLTEIVLE